jgi:hypothetical protein
MTDSQERLDEALREIERLKLQLLLQQQLTQGFQFLAEANASMTDAVVRYAGTE